MFSTLKNHSVTWKLYEPSLGDLKTQLSETQDMEALEPSPFVHRLAPGSHFNGMYTMTIIIHAHVLIHLLLLSQLYHEVVFQKSILLFYEWLAKHHSKLIREGKIKLESKFSLKIPSLLDNSQTMFILSKHLHQQSKRRVIGRMDSSTTERHGLKISIGL